MAGSYEALPVGEKSVAGISKLRRLRGLLPWILQRSSANSSRQLRKTAYLDGLRGFAAFIVYLQHMHTDAHLNTPRERAWGHEGQYYFMNFPYIRFFFDGGTCGVAIFFIISGYVLSMKPLTLIHSKQYEKLSENVGSALFRRWARLFVPLITTVWGFITICWIFQAWNPLWDRKDTYIEEMRNMYSTLQQFTFVFGMTMVLLYPYNIFLWTIPLEFKGSIAVYTTLLAISRLRRNVRLGVGALLLWYFFVITPGSWYCANFIGGMLLCDIDAMIARDTLPTWIANLEPKRFKKLTWMLIFMFGMYLASIPSKDDIADLKLYSWLLIFKPSATGGENWFFYWFAGMIVVTSSLRIGWLKRFLETRFCQYLGRISYALYLVHGPVMWTAGVRIFSMLGCLGWYHNDKIPAWSEKFSLPGWGIYGLEVNYIASQVILMPFTFWIAELVTTYIDEATVSTMQKIYRKGLEED